MSDTTVKELVDRLQEHLLADAVLIRVPVLRGGEHTLPIRTIQLENYTKNGKTILAALIVTYPIFSQEDGQ